MPLDLSLDAGQLTAQLVDIESVSQAEQPLADAIEAALASAAPHLTVHRDGNALVARTTQLSAIADHMINAPVGLRVSLGLGLFAFVFIAVAEKLREFEDELTANLFAERERGRVAHAGPSAALLSNEALLERYVGVTDAADR